MYNPLPPTAPTLLPDIHGHRGCRGLFPENTLPAFRHAVAMGVAVLEMDVVISADKQVVVSHEPWFSAAICRKPDGQPIDPAHEMEYNLYQLPYAKISGYDCGLTRHPRFPQQQLAPAYKPLLGEVIRAVDAQATQLARSPVRFSIELKCEPAGDHIFHPAPAEFLDLVLAVLGEEQATSRATLLSFDHRILQMSRHRIPQLPVCLLIEDDRPLAEHLHILGYQPPFLGPDYRLLTPELLQETKRLGIQLVPWTVNDAATMRHLIRAGVAGITTDYPDVLQQVLAAR